MVQLLAIGLIKRQACLRRESLINIAGEKL